MSKSLRLFEKIRHKKQSLWLVSYGKEEMGRFKNKEDAIEFAKMYLVKPYNMNSAFKGE